MFVRYIACVGLLNLFWEMLQLPLYTLWYESPPATIAFAVVHCTVGDVLIATVSFFAAVVLSGAINWPQKHYGRVALMAGIFGVCYTVFSEWNNTVVTRTWAAHPLGNRAVSRIAMGADPRVGILETIPADFGRPNLRTSC